MSDIELLTDLNKRRNVFRSHFPMIKIGRAQSNASATEITKNSCPACGYMSLPARNMFDICPICFWEDDGSDDLNLHQTSGANSLSLSDYRLMVLRLFENIKTSDYRDIRRDIKMHLLQLDGLIKNYSPDKKQDIQNLNNTLMLIFIKNNIFGVKSLFDDEE